MRQVTDDRVSVQWEPGELRYQQNLQRKDPAAFKALLERNGIKYDPVCQGSRSLDVVGVSNT